MNLVGLLRRRDGRGRNRSEVHEGDVGGVHSDVVGATDTTGRDPCDDRRVVEDAYGDVGSGQVPGDLDRVRPRRHAAVERGEIELHQPRSCTATSPAVSMEPNRSRAKRPPKRSVVPCASCPSTAGAEAESSTAAGVVPPRRGEHGRAGDGEGVDDPVDPPPVVRRRQAVGVVVVDVDVGEDRHDLATGAAYVDLTMRSAGGRATACR